MNPTVIQLINLAIQLLLAALVWSYYRNMTCPPHLKYATFGPRFWTGTVDSCVMWPISFIASVLLALRLPSAVGVALILLQNLVWLFYVVSMHAKYGQTYGKMVCKVRVVDHKTEGAISFRQAFLREGIPIAVSLSIVGYEVYLIGTGAATAAAVAKGEFAQHRAFWLLASMPALWFVAEAVTMLTNDKRRALHDYIAGTVVIRTNLLQ